MHTEKNTKKLMCPCHLTLKFSGFRAVVREHVRAKFHRAKCSGWWLILRTEREKNSAENITVRRYRADTNKPERLAHYNSGLLRSTRPPTTRCMDKRRGLTAVCETTSRFRQHGNEDQF